jgi:hypothetical protein
VLCAGSALLLVEDESTSVVNGALVGVLLSQSVSPSVVLSALLLIDIPWFLNRGKTCCYIHQNLLLGFTNKQAIKFSGAVAGEEWKTSARGVFRTHILYFVLLYFIYFTCIVLYQKHKKLVYFIVSFIYLLLVHYAVP